LRVFSGSSPPDVRANDDRGHRPVWVMFRLRRGG
jgi:hypothetical protein